MDIIVRDDFPTFLDDRCWHHDIVADQIERKRVGADDDSEINWRREVCYL